MLLNTANRTNVTHDQYIQHKQYKKKCKKTLTGMSVAESTNHLPHAPRPSQSRQPINQPSNVE